MNNAIDKTDLDLTNEVSAELDREWSIKIRDITILVEDRTVTLNGYVSNYIEKLQAVQVVKRVVGIKSITDNLKIEQAYFYYLTERELTAKTIRQVDWATSLSPSGTGASSIHNGWLKLNGRWKGTKKAAQSTSYGTYDVSEGYLICSR